MAQPWKHPDTGTYYLRRQIPEKLRPAFEGKALVKQSLKTKDPSKASQLFVAANAKLEEQFEQARQRLAATGDSRPCQRSQADHLVRGYFQGEARSEGGLSGPERLILAFREVERGLWNAQPFDPVSGVGYLAPIPPSSADEWWALANNVALYKLHPATEPRKGADAPSAKWHALAHLPAELRQAQAGRVAEQIQRHFDLLPDKIPDPLNDAILDFLDATRLDIDRAQRKRPHGPSRLRPAMRLRELFGEWECKEDAPSRQTALEYRQSVEDFIDLIGDIPVQEILEDDLYAFRDAVAALPAAMPKADRLLNFLARHEKHKDCEGRKVSPTTVKKRVGGIQALLSYAKSNLWISQNVGIRLPVEGYSKKKAAIHVRSFLDGEIVAFFNTQMFLAPETWDFRKNGLLDVSAFWLSLIAATTGARMEEIGQASLRDLRSDLGIVYIDIDDYVADDDDETKSVKTDGSRRIVPLHKSVIDLGLIQYAEALKTASCRRLFPDLVANSLGKKTKTMSQKLGRYIDKHVTSDRRLRFHSFRHSFKQRGTGAFLDHRILDQLCGHAATSVGDKYGEGQPLSVLHTALHRIDFSLIPWDAMTQACSVLDWATIAEKVMASVEGQSTSRKNAT